MKKIFKIILLILCVLLIPLSTVHANINGLIYVLFVKAPRVVYVPSFEFEAGNSLIVIGASWEYGELTGRWQEAPLGPFSFFQAQVERSETETTTTIPDIPDIPDNIPGRIQLSEVQPAEETTKFLINLSGFSFTPLEPFDDFSILVGTGAYLGADVIFTGFSATTGEPTCSSIDPKSGKQKETDIQIDLVGINTNFVENETTVTFSGTGIRVSGVTVVSTTKISFNIAIDEEATEGARDVVVSYPSGVVTCDQAFTVEPL